MLKLKDFTTEKSYDLIMIIINKLIKYFIIILFYELYTVEQLSFIFLDWLIRNYKILKIIISDRNKLFISSYWRILINFINIKQKLLISFHSKTDK